jgi:hypothetical protein
MPRNDVPSSASRRLTVRPLTVARGHSTLQHAAIVVEVEVVVAAALRGPADLLPLRQEVEVVVQIYPGIAPLREEFARIAAGHGVGKQSFG